MKIEIQTTKEIEITKEDFIKYENCRESGITNMFDIKNVEIITKLNRDKIITIMKNYNILAKNFLK